MQNEDHAIIIGLHKYPGLGVPQLEGPEEDAKKFEQWILKDTGGDVPKKNVTHIYSSDFKESPPSLYLTRPTDLEIGNAFQNFLKISNENMDAGNGPRVGRRLYIYMSGHGIAPIPLGSTTEESALLTANTDPTQIKVARYHIPGDYVASWLCRNDFFDEVLLFMDCCREVATVPYINQLFSPTGSSTNGVKFYGFATKWSRLAREKKFDKKKAEGIFTKTLLLGLNGAAAEPDPNNAGGGIITFESLQSYLVNNMKQFIDPKFRNDPQGQEPEVIYKPEHKKHVIIKTDVQKFSVTINAPAGATGEVGIYSNAEKKIIQRIPVNELPKNVELHREEYALVAIIDGKPEFIPLSVTGIENAA